jgi:formylglycine-generating enzyme
MSHPKLLFTALSHDAQRLLLEIVGPEGTWQVPIDKEQAKRLGTELLQLSEGKSSEEEIFSQFIKELMVRLPSGKLWMGSMPSEGIPKEELPRHPVVLKQPYSIASLPVTQGLYRWIMGSNPSLSKGSKKPVETVSWFDALEFCNALSKNQGLQPCYDFEDDTVNWNQAANGFRLPTEAEWEYAARTRDDLHYSGGDRLDAVGWFDGNCNDLSVVGGKASNAWGLYDMSGSVFEWCWDWHAAYSKGELLDPQGPKSGTERVCRGGAWNHGNWFARATCRHCDLPTSRSSSIGFRVARSIHT